MKTPDEYYEAKRVEASQLSEEIARVKREMPDGLAKIKLLRDLEKRLDFASYVGD